MDFLSWSSVLALHCLLKFDLVISSPNRTPSPVPRCQVYGSSTECTPDRPNLWSKDPSTSPHFHNRTCLFRIAQLLLWWMLPGNPHALSLAPHHVSRFHHSATRCPYCPQWKKKQLSSEPLPFTIRAFKSISSSSCGSTNSSPVCKARIHGFDSVWTSRLTSLLCTHAQANLIDDVRVDLSVQNEVGQLHKLLGHFVGKLVSSTVCNGHVRHFSVGILDVLFQDSFPHVRAREKPPYTPSLCFWCRALASSVSGFCLRSSLCKLVAAWSKLQHRNTPPPLPCSSRFGRGLPLSASRHGSAAGSSNRSQLTGPWNLDVMWVRELIALRLNDPVSPDPWWIWPPVRRRRSRIPLPFCTSSLHIPRNLRQRWEPHCTCLSKRRVSRPALKVPVALTNCPMRFRQHSTCATRSIWSFKVGREWSSWIFAGHHDAFATMSTVYGMQMFSFLRQRWTQVHMSYTDATRRRTEPTRRGAEHCQYTFMRDKRKAMKNTCAERECTIISFPPVIDVNLFHLESHRPSRVNFLMSKTSPRIHHPECTGSRWLNVPAEINATLSHLLRSESSETLPAEQVLVTYTCTRTRGSDGIGNHWLRKFPS